MTGIITLNTPPHAFRFTFPKPCRTVKDFIGSQEVSVYLLTPWLCHLFPGIQKRLQKKHSVLIYSEEWEQNAPSLSPIFWNRTEEILSLTHNGTPREFAILCQEEIPGLRNLLKTLSPFARSVSLITESDDLFDALSEEALSEYGLTVNRREISKLHGADLIFLLSGEYALSRLKDGYLINLTNKEISVSIPVLSAITNSKISSFLARHPYLQVNPSLLLSEEDTVTRLIWKYC